MLLKDILKELLPIGEIKQRLNNNQIKVNNVSVKDINLNLDINDYYFELGDFIQIHCNDKLFINTCNILNFRDFFGEENTNIFQFEFLTGFTLITISKKEEYVFINN